MRNRLRVLRADRRKKMSQMTAARRSGIGFNRYWRIENGYAEATDQERQRLARLFKVSIDEVFPPTAPNSLASVSQEAAP